MKLRLLPILFAFIGLIGCGEDVNPEDGGSGQDTLATLPQGKDSVIARLDVALRDDISNASLYHQRAKRYGQLGEFMFAEQDILRALNLDSKNCGYNVTYSNLFLLQNKLSEAEEVLQNILRVNDQCPNVFIALGDVYLYRRENKKSIEYLDEALKLDVYNAIAYYKKGINFMEMGDTTTAISSMQTAVEQDGNFYDAYVQLGVLMAGKGDPLAEDYYKAALRLDTNSVEVMYNLGIHYQQTDKYNEAIKIYNDITKKAPKFKEAYFNLGYIHMVLLKAYQPAIPYFTKAIELDPSMYYQAYYNRGYCYELIGDIGNAEKDYRKALDIRPDYTLAAQGIGRVKGELTPDNKPVGQ